MSEETMPPEAPTGTDASADSGTGRPAVEIRTVNRADPFPRVLRGAYLDAPRPSQVFGAYCFEVAGWALGQDAPVAQIEIRSRGVVLKRVPVKAPRRDIAELHPELDWSGRSGFRCLLNAAVLPRLFDLDVVAVLEGDERIPVGSISGTRRDPAAVPDGHLQPIMLTTLGRSGSTWVTRLLGQHPAVTAYAPFRYEPRAASYWMEMYGAMTEPGSYHQTLRGELYGPDWWVGSRRSPVGPPVPDTLESWLAEGQPGALLPLAIDRIEAFYRRAAELEGETGLVTAFAEKFTTNSFVQPLLSDLYPGAREIILVRDFRDMVCSMVAYNRKRGYQGFGRDQVDSDEDFVRWWHGGAVQMLNEWRSRSDTAWLLRYEDLVTEPAKTLAALFDHAGLDARKDTIEGIIERATRMTPNAQKLHRTSDDPAASIGRWREEMSPSLQEAAAGAFEDVLREFGYAA